MSAEQSRILNETLEENARLQRAAAERDALRVGLEELLSVAERMCGGDPSLDPEEWYAIRDYARKVLA